jgi:hypothetical protein
LNFHRFDFLIRFSKGFILFQFMSPFQGLILLFS